MKRVFGCLFFFSLMAGVSTRLPAQTLLTDSMQAILQQDNLSLQQRAITLSRLAAVVSYSNMSKAKPLNLKAIHIAQKAKGSDALAFCWAQQIGMEVRDGKDSLAIQAMDSALFYVSSATPLMHGYALYMKGFMQNMQNYPDKALATWQQALHYLSDLSEPEAIDYQAGIYYQMYAIFAERNDSLNANVYANLALKKSLKSRDQTMITACWQISGTNFLDNFFRGKDSLQLDSAVYAYRRSLEVFRKYENWIKDPAVVILSALNLANIYMEYYPQIYLDSARENINLALRISKKVPRKTLEINCYQVISRLYRKMGQYDRAEQALLKGKLILDSLNPPDYATAKNIYKLLAQVNEEKGNYVGALRYYKQYTRCAFTKKSKEKVVHLLIMSYI